MKRYLPLSVLLGLIGLTLLGCGGGSGLLSTGNSQPPAVFVTGEDAPLPSVLGFTITLNSITLNSSTGGAPLLTQPTIVDFARLVGMRSLLGFSSVPADTYTSATFTLTNPVISYLNIGTNPPTVSTINGTLTTTTVTVSFPQALTVGANGLAGLHMDFNLRKSLQVDGTGQITGIVDPQIDIQAVRASDDGGKITDFNGGLVSVNAAANSFVVQGPFGFQVTIDVNNQTQFNSNWNINSLAPPAFVSVQGTMQGDGSILASAVEVIATTQAFVSGRVLAVNPNSGPAQTVTMYVGEELPALNGIPVGSVLTLDISQVTQFDICFFDNWFTNILLNNSSLVAGQRIFIGGSYDSASNTFTPSAVSLRRQGIVGDLVQNSVVIVNGNQGSFQLQNNFLLGYLLGAPITVQTGNATNFVNINGLAGLQSAGATNLVVRGLVLKDPNTAAPVMWAHRVRVLP